MRKRKSIPNFFLFNRPPFALGENTFYLEERQVVSGICFQQRGLEVADGEAHLILCGTDNHFRSFVFHEFCHGRISSQEAPILVDDHA